MKTVDLSEVADIIYKLVLESQKNRFNGLTKKEISALSFSREPGEGL